MTKSQMVQMLMEMVSPELLFDFVFYTINALLAVAVLLVVMRLILHWLVTLVLFRSASEVNRRQSPQGQACPYCRWAAVVLITVVLFAVTVMATETVDGTQITIIDGDTVALPCASLADGCAETIWLTAIDAPESVNPSCETELQAGLRAKARLAELLRAGRVEIIRSGRSDRYGRTLADLMTPAGDAGAVLVSEGLALPYRPGQAAKLERTAHWCR